MKLKLKPGKGGQVEVFDTVALKLPEAERGTSIVFISERDDSIQREDPRQRSLDGIKSVDTVVREIRDVRNHEVPEPRSLAS